MYLVHYPGEYGIVTSRHVARILIDVILVHIPSPLKLRNETTILTRTGEEDCGMTRKGERIRGQGREVRYLAGRTLSNIS